ncbi:MAG: NAD(P)H-binding protein [Salinivirgaceae bacterium]|nr:NAD(P)H-binding protein [Salinivirgaceae bacterium]
MGNEKMKAVILGGTGLVGSELVKELVEHEGFSELILLARRQTGLNHKKIKELVINFDKPEEWNHLIKGDVLFSTFGTTIKKAGSQEEQYKIDYTYQLQIAQAASNNRMKSFVLVSAIGANAKSGMFYNRIKGELDEAVKILSFSNISILKPSFLAGDRQEKRVAERVGSIVLSVLKYLPFVRKYRPIHAKIVAKAMINAALLNAVKTVYTGEEIFELAI